MKVLFAAYRHDPTESGTQTGADYQFLKALQNNQVETMVVGPFLKPPVLAERAVKRFFTGALKGKYAKYDLTNTLRASRAVNEWSGKWKPDVILSLYPPPYVFYHGNVPCVFRTDVPFLGLYAQAPELVRYRKESFLLNVWMEKRALRKSAAVITHSAWAAQSLADQYHVDPRKIAIFPNPSSLPNNLIPPASDIWPDKDIADCLRLLFVGRDSYRKGLDIAIEVVNQLNRNGAHFMLIVCGMDGESQDRVQYAGYLDINEEKQRERYLSLLRSSHLLLHPARFDPSPRVASEAAAFGTPTITNDSGGLATSVENGVSGIVVPRNSSANVYVKEIVGLFRHPERYYELCRAARKRYDNELNWDAAGRALLKILRDVAENRVSNKRQKNN
jgi:glycosyltransferase involved in cell wall biosynthesis